MDGSSEGGSQVGWARGDVTEMLIVRELADGLDVSGGSAESVEDLEDTSSLLHGDDSELILLIDPDEESLGVVVEDTSSGWPVSVKVASSQESVSLPIFEKTVRIYINNIKEIKRWRCTYLKRKWSSMSCF